MKTKYPNLFGILAALMLVASFVVPANLVSPSSVAADPGICKWDTLREPGNLTGVQVIATNTDPIDIAVGSDGATIVVVEKCGPPTCAAVTNILKYSSSGGMF